MLYRLMLLGMVHCWGLYQPYINTGQRQPAETTGTYPSKFIPTTKVELFALHIMRNCVSQISTKVNSMAAAPILSSQL